MDPGGPCLLQAQLRHTALLCCSHPCKLRACVDPALPFGHLSLRPYHPLEKYGLGLLSPQIPQTFQGLFYGLNWAPQLTY